MSVNRIDEFLGEIAKDLDRTVNYWMKYSIDTEYGGFFNCLSKSGELYDDQKYGWLQGRQTWTFARLYNTMDRFRREDILNAAEQGAEFMLKHQKDPKTWKCFFKMSRDGKAMKIQKTIFTECFYLMGMSELAIATGQQKYKDEAVGMMEKIIHWTQVDDTDLGQPKLPGIQATSSFAIPMMLLAVIDQMITMDKQLEDEYKQLSETCVSDTLKHVQRNGTVIFENVSKDGKELPGSAGRLLLPGHSIEGGWFLLQIAQRQNNEELKKTAIEKFMLNPFNYGWDSTDGGLFYFLDADGHSPTQLEWNMKLWWAHNEAMIAFLMAYEETNDQAHLDRFAQVYDYSYKHFVDKENGEWYGYLNQNGSVSMDFKGGPFKGCFHVPRCLYMCELILQRIKQSKK